MVISLYKKLMLCTLNIYFTPYSLLLMSYLCTRFFEEMKKKRFKIKKVVGSVVATLLLVVVAVLLVVSFKGGDIAKKYLEEHDVELVGREIAIGDIDVSLLNSCVSIDDLCMKEQDGKTDFFKFDSLFVDIDLFDLLSKKVNLQHVHLTGVKVDVLQRDSVFNFTDIINHFSKTDSVVVKDDTVSSGWEIGLNDIRLKHCSVLYKDLMLKSEFDLKDVNITVPGVYFAGQSTDVGLDLNFQNGGSLHAEMKYDIASSDFQILARLKDLSIDCVKPYMRQGVRVGTVDGLLDAEAVMVGDFNHIMNFTLKGKSALKNVKVIDDLGRLVLSANHTSAELVRLNLTDNEIHLGLVDGDGIASQFLIDKDGKDNISYFVASPEAEERKERRDSLEKDGPGSKDTEDKPLKFIIDKVNMRNMSMVMEDASLTEPFHYEVKDFCVKAENVSLDKPNDVSVSGRIGRTGSIEARWRGSLNDMANQNIMASITNVDLTEFTPYFNPIFAYRITGGNMSLVSQNVIVNNELKGVNQLAVMNCTVDKDKQMENPEFKVPLKTALYVVKDKNGRISFDLPVAGNIDSPEFNYKKIIVKTLIDFLVKVAESPVKSLGKVFGKSDDFSRVPFDPAATALSVETYDQLNKLIEMLNQKPELKVKLVQRINYSRANEDMALQLLKTDFYLVQHPEKTVSSLELIDVDAIEKLNVSDSAFVAFASSKTGNELRKPTKVAAKLYAEAAATEIARLAEQRNGLVRQYLTQQMGENATAVDVVALPFSADESYAGNTVLELELLEE